MSANYFIAQRPCTLLKKLLIILRKFSNISINNINLNTMKRSSKLIDALQREGLGESPYDRLIEAVLEYQL
ncbi:hypothetical protein UT300013_20900 [Paraclostridium sordellii]